MKKLALAATVATLGLPASATDYRPIMESYFEAEIAGWLNDPAVLEAIREQNTRTKNYDQAEIDALDLTWRAEVGSNGSALITGVMESPASDFLRERLEQAGGAISEIFTMDARGLVVAASDVTSDYWQGDEDKFQKTYDVGPGSIHVSDVEFDESSQTYQGQVSVTILDPADNSPIGAITVGLNAEALF